MSRGLSAVIVTYNSREFVGTCIESLLRWTASAPLEVIVVDNASSDGTGDLVARDFPNVQLIRRASNAGLSAAINEGVLASTGEFVAVLNPDLRFEQDVLGPLAAYLRANPDAGAVAPKLLDDDGTLQLSCRRFPGHATAIFNRYSLLTRLSPKNRYSSDYLMSDFDHASIRDVDWVSGAAVMLPRRVFDEVGGWDTGYFMFNEDVDLCRRLQNVGYRVVYDPDVCAYHHIGVSKSTSRRMVVERHKSMWRYYRKHLRRNAAVDALTGAGIAARCGVMLVANAVRELPKQ